MPTEYFNGKICPNTKFARSKLVTLWLYAHALANDKPSQNMGCFDLFKLKFVSLGNFVLILDLLPILSEGQLRRKTLQCPDQFSVGLFGTISRLIDLHVSYSATARLSILSFLRQIQRLDIF